MLLLCVAAMTCLAGGIIWLWQLAGSCPPGSCLVQALLGWLVIGLAVLCVGTVTHFGRYRSHVWFALVQGWLLAVMFYFTLVYSPAVA